MRTDRFQTMSKAERLLSNGVKPARTFSSTLKFLDRYRMLVTIKKNTPKTKKTKRLHRVLSDLILYSKRALGIKVEPNRKGIISYTNILSPESKQSILGSLKERLEEGSLGFALPKVMATEKWKDVDGREV